jgi:hypothetical protein
MYTEAEFINTGSTNHIIFLNHEDPKVEPGVCVQVKKVAVPHRRPIRCLVA